MFKIQTLNAISDVIHNELSAGLYTVAKEEPIPDGILVRSANMHEMPLGDNLLAIARAGAGDKQYSHRCMLQGWHCGVQYAGCQCKSP